MEMGWFPNDMDVYVPVTDELHPQPQPIHYMTRVEGYQVVHQSNSKPLTHYSTQPEIKDIMHLEKGSTWVDIVISANQVPISPIFQFYSMTVMNLITGCGLFLTYPCMTCDCWGLYNPMVFSVERFSPSLPPHNVWHALEKYSDRGFDIRQNPYCWPGEWNGHICSEHVDCPQTSRTLHNKGCLYLTLWDMDQNIGIGSDTGWLDKDVCRYGIQMTWSISSTSCNKRVDGTGGKIHAHPLWLIPRLIR